MSRDSESLSLATALIESVRRLAVRVRHASAAASRKEGGTPPAPPADVEVRLVGARLRVGLLLLVCAEMREERRERQRQRQTRQTDREREGGRGGGAYSFVVLHPHHHHQYL